MPRFQGSRQFREALKVAPVEAIHKIAEWLADAMYNLVAVQCTAFERGGTALDYRHSYPGEPPRRESGTGQDSIAWEPLEDGAIVGVVGIGTKNMVGENYMAGWDSKEGIRGVRRPWLTHPSLGWKRYQPEMMRMLAEHMRRKTGGQ